MGEEGMQWEILMAIDRYFGFSYIVFLMTSKIIL